MENINNLNTPLGHEELKKFKHEFYTYRNGIIADRLRSAGDCHKIIFGLNIPQLVNIANEYGKNVETARLLWNNSTCRESRLLAPMLFPIEIMQYDEACQWIESIENIEIADNLCHKLLKRLNYAQELIIKYSTHDSDILRYTAFRLAINLICINAITNYETIINAAKHEMASDCNMTGPLCKEIIEEFVQE